jgi:hypothetical protein
VFSGIAPPQAVLDALAAHPTEAPQQPPRPAMSSSTYSSGLSTTPGGISNRPGPNTSSQLPTYESVPNNAYNAPLQNSYDDAPPSYEDAIAETIPPIDGPRPNYRPPPGSGMGVGAESSTNSSGSGYK